MVVLQDGDVVEESPSLPMIVVSSTVSTVGPVTAREVVDLVVAASLVLIL